MDFFYRAGALLKMHNAALATADLSVRLSVCPSVTFRCFVRRNEDTIMHLCVSTTMTLVSGETFAVLSITLYGGVKVRHPPVGSENLTNNQP